MEIAVLEQEFTLKTFRIFQIITKHFSVKIINSISRAGKKPWNDTGVSIEVIDPLGTKPTLIPQ